MLVALFAVLGVNNAFALGTLNGTTQYGDNGFKYKILHIYKNPSGTKVNEVSVSQNVYADQGDAALVIPATVEIYVKGTDDETTPQAVDQKITFKIVEIEDNAFLNVTKATSIQIGSNIKKIGTSAFEGCEKAASITFDANENDMTIADNAFKGTKPKTLDLTPIAGTLVANKWFGAFATGVATNSTLTQVKFNAKLTKIVGEAFAGFTKLTAKTSIVFPTTGLTGTEFLTIEAGAFKETPIEELDLTEARIQELNKLFEDDNVTLKKVDMAKTVVTLKENALANCIQLSDVDFTKSTKLTTLEGGCLSNTIVSEYDFSKCYELTTGTPVTYVTPTFNFTVGQNPFVNGTTKTNKNLTTVKLPFDAGMAYSPVTVIGTVFANCEKLATITNLENSRIETVDHGAFANDIALTALSFPGTVKNVNNAPFYGCKELASLTFDGSALLTIGSGDVVYTFNSYGAADKSTVYSTGGTAKVLSYDALAGTATIRVLTNPGYDAFIGKVYTVEGVDLSAKPTETLQLKENGTAIPVWVSIEDPFVAITDGEQVSGNLFGNLIYDGTAFDSKLTTLKITLPAASPKNSTAVKIAKGAFDFAKSALTTIEIAKDGEFKGEIEANAITMNEAANGTVTFGDIETGAKFNTIAGPKGTYTATLTMGKYTAATLTTAPIVSGTLSSATVLAVAQADVLNAIGQAKVINFNGNIAIALSAPTAPNAALTTLNFGDVDILNNAIVATTFDDDNAPNLTAMTWQPTGANEPATGETPFAIDAFWKGGSARGAAAVISFTTNAAVAKLYDYDEANLYNVIFSIKKPGVDPEYVNITVLGKEENTGYYYGKLKAGTANVAISKAKGDEQVMVYSAFVDNSDNTIYMDPLAKLDGEYVVEKNEIVIIRVKNPQSVVARDAEDLTKGYQKTYSDLAVTTTKENTMRSINEGGTYKILNDLQITDKVFSSDYIGTTYVGKTLWAMANPANEGALVWKKVDGKSYLPKEAVFVETTTPAARLNIVWLDGNEDVTGIIERLNDQKFNNAAIYNLQGVRVSAPVKGQIYIKNGKKFIVK